VCFVCAIDAKRGQASKAKPNREKLLNYLYQDDEDFKLRVERSQPVATSLNETVAEDVDGSGSSSDIDDSLPDSALSLDYQDPIEDPQYNIPTIAICGRPYYCREGCRGPCRANEIFKFSASTRYSSPLTCPSVQSLWIHGCRPAHTGSAVRTNSGHCVPQRPCTGYPSSYRYYAQTRRCYPTRPRWSRSSHCGAGKVFVDVDGVSGDCVCSGSNTLTWKTTGRCYRANTRGPCRNGEWLQMDARGYAICRPCPCPHLADGRHIYMEKFGRPRCFRSGARGLCRAGRSFVVTSVRNNQGRCVYPPRRYRNRRPSYGYGRSRRRPYYNWD